MRRGISGVRAFAARRDGDRGIDLLGGTQHDTGPFWFYAMPEDFYYDTILKEAHANDTL